MYDAPGIGLAAIQVGEPLRMLVIDLAKEGEPTRRRRSSSIPKSWTARDERSVYEEGCLSIPDYYAEVERPATVRVRYLDRDGKQQEIEADGLLATCLQHEIDHLERRAVHRPHLEAEARHGGQEVQEARPATARRPRWWDDGDPKVCQSREYLISLISNIGGAYE